VKGYKRITELDREEIAVYLGRGETILVVDDRSEQRELALTMLSGLGYRVNAISGGTDAQGEVTVQLRFNGRNVVGHGADLDVIVASARAYINALNRLEFLKRAPKKIKPEYE